MMQDEKADAREQARALRAAITSEERILLSAAIAGRLTALPELLDARLVAGYLATAEEADPAPALRTLVERGAVIAYPRVAGPGALTLHVVRSERDLEEWRFGIRQPKVTSPSVDPGDVDVIIVPGVAFDPEGHRLGYGGGYYDRLLPKAPSAFRVGIAFESQLFADLPHEAHDTTVDAIVTPERVIRTERDTSRRA